MLIENQKTIEELEKCRNSNSTNESSSEEKISTFSGEFSKNFRKEFFVNKVSSQNKKFNKKAISWIQAQCWSNNMTISIVVQASSLYYCYIYNKQMEKSSFEPLLIACILLASKFFGGSLSTLQDAIALTSTKYELSVISKLEAEILALTNFDIFFPSVVDSVENISLSPEQCSCLYFCIELLLLKDHDVLFNEDIFSQLEMLLLGRSIAIVTKLLEALKFPQSELLINKYRALFQVDEFIKNL